MILKCVSFQHLNFNPIVILSNLLFTLSFTGKEYAFALARRGLNIILISRSADKDEIQSEHTVQVKTVVADFSGVDIYDHIEKEITGYDVGVLINNVGVGHKLDYFLNIPNR